MIKEYSINFNKQRIKINKDSLSYEIEYYHVIDYKMSLDLAIANFEGIILKYEGLKTYG